MNDDVNMNNMTTKGNCGNKKDQLEGLRRTAQRHGRDTGRDTGRHRPARAAHGPRRNILLSRPTFITTTCSCSLPHMPSYHSRPFGLFPYLLRHNNFSGSDHFCPVFLIVITNFDMTTTVSTMYPHGVCLTSPRSPWQRFRRI